MTETMKALILRVEEIIGPPAPGVKFVWASELKPIPRETPLAA
jgi:hypothetical protein